MSSCGELELRLPPKANLQLGCLRLDHPSLPFDHLRALASFFVLLATIELFLVGCRMTGVCDYLTFHEALFELASDAT
jgi:hypothetical protein